MQVTTNEQTNPLILGNERIHQTKLLRLVEPMSLLI